MHISLFGFELTIRAPFEEQSEVPLVSFRSTETEPERREVPKQARVKAHSLSSRFGGWTGLPEHHRARVGGIEFGPLPVRSMLAGLTSRFQRPAIFSPLSSRLADSPPVPPPRDWV